MEVQNSVWPSSESDLWYRVISMLCLDFTLGSFSFTGGSNDFDSVFIKTWSVSMNRLKLLLLVMYVNSISVMNGKFWGKKRKHPEILFPSWYKNGLLLLTCFFPGNVFYLLKDYGLTSGWKSKQNRRKVRIIKSKCLLKATEKHFFFSWDISIFQLNHMLYIYLTFVQKSHKDLLTVTSCNKNGVPVKQIWRILKTN